MFMVILVPVAVLDLLVGLRIARVKITRQLPNNLSLGSWIKVNLEIRHRFIRPAFIQVFDHYPLDTKTNLLPLTVKLTPGNISKIYYRLQPVKRGDINFGKIQYRHLSLLGLWHVNKFSGQPTSTRVYPNFGEIKKYILLGLDDRTSQLGIRRQQRRG